MEGVAGRRGRIAPAGRGHAIPRFGEARARANYMAALFMARQQASLDGVLRVAGAFSTLGDHETVERCIATAERLAAAAQGPSSHPAFATERAAY